MCISIQLPVFCAGTASQYTLENATTEGGGCRKTQKTLNLWLQVYSERKGQGQRMAFWDLRCKKPKTTKAAQIIQEIHQTCWSLPLPHLPRLKICWLWEATGKNVPCCKTAKTASTKTFCSFILQRTFGPQATQLWENQISRVKLFQPFQDCQWEGEWPSPCQPSPYQLWVKHFIKISNLFCYLM